MTEVRYMRECKDCKWCDNRWNEKYKKYIERDNIGIDLALCKKSKYLYCNIEREDGIIWAFLLKTCGKRTRFFEPRKVKLKYKKGVND